MKSTFTLATVLLLAALSALNPADMPQARMDEKHRAFFTSYCVECHNEKKQKGKLRLDDLSFVLDSVEKADTWQKVLNQINSGEMPPEDSKQPERGAKTEFLDALSHTLVCTTQRSTASWLLNAAYAADWQAFQRDGKVDKSK